MKGKIRVREIVRYFFLFGIIMLGLTAIIGTGIGGGGGSGGTCTDADNDGYYVGSGCGTADTDADGDGTPDDTDGCPNDVNKAAPGACGCGEVEQAVCSPYSIAIDDRSGEVGGAVTFTIEIHDALIDIDALMFDLYYDQSVLQYQSHTWGDLLAAGNWTKALNPDLTDRLRVGGMNPYNTIPAGSSGTLVQITFTVVGCGASQMDLTRLVDDLAGYAERDGKFTCLGDAGEEDCDDTDAGVNPGAGEVSNDGQDNDCDGSVDEVCGACTDVDYDGYYVESCCGTEQDCDDTDAGVYPGADEICDDGIDQDCDGSDRLCLTCYRDADGDGYGNPSMTIEDLLCPAGYVADNTDCDDTDADVNPGAGEVCGDGQDNDCDGSVDKGCGTCTDADRDGYCSTEDCDDNDPDAHPGAAEVCDGADNDCDEDVDEGVMSTFYLDGDDDGYGDAASSTLACAAPAGYVDNSLDCDDNDPDAYPGAEEICSDCVDNDCDGQIDEDCSSGTASTIPDTGHTTCYNATDVLTSCPTACQDFYGQDAIYNISSPSYTKLDSSGNSLPDSATSWAMIRDNVTGLIWENKTDDGTIHDKDNTYTGADAVDVFMAQLNADNFGGHSDWRLPTYKELAYLIYYGTYSSPTIDTDYFPNTNITTAWPITGGFYSSTPDAEWGDGAWEVRFETGRGSSLNKTALYYVRAIRGEPMASQSFTDNGDGTITDNNTGLMWMKYTADTNGDVVVDLNDKVNWQNALSWCEGLSLAGYDDWRLPNIKELLSIAKLDTYNPAIDITYFNFPEGVSYLDAYYWTSTTVTAPEIYKTIAFNLRFYKGGGFDSNVKRNATDFVRAVRGGM